MKGSNYIYNDFSHTTVCSVWDKGYRFGFNGMEKANEFSGDCNSYTTEYRQLDVRLGRWFSIDPITIAYQSPYVSMDCNPTRNIDPNGDKIIPVGDETKKDIKYLRKNDKEFNKKYKQWKRDYRGKELRIQKVGDEKIFNSEGEKEKAKTLNEATPQGNHKNGQDNNKKENWLYYSAIEGAHQGAYSVFDATFTTNRSGSFYLSNGENKQGNIEFSASFKSPMVFKEWELRFNKGSFTIGNPFDEANQGKQGYSANFSINDKNSESVILTYDLQAQYWSSSYFNTYELSSRGIYEVARSHDVPGRIIHYSLIAMSHPIIVKVPRDRKGNYNWSKVQYNYVPLSGEKAQPLTR
jgi:RHS repeat-associated protein